MDREIKFRLPHYTFSGIFEKFTYWGVGHDFFTSPSSVAGTTKKTSEQFTGLKDKNGKEIFEGDLLNYFIFGANREIVTPVIWVGDFATFGTQQDRTFDWLRYSGKIEVVGNIHESPELINK